MLDTIQNIFNAFGAIVFVPVILFIVAKGMALKRKRHWTVRFFPQWV